MHGKAKVEFSLNWGDYNESICAYNKAIDLNPLDESAITERDLAIDSNSPKLVICQIGKSERTGGGLGGPEATGGSPKPKKTQLDPKTHRILLQVRQVRG